MSIWGKRHQTSKSQYGYNRCIAAIRGGGAEPKKSYPPKPPKVREPAKPSKPAYSGSEHYGLDPRKRPIHAGPPPAEVQILEELMTLPDKRGLDAA